MHILGSYEDSPRLFNDYFKSIHFSMMFYGIYVRSMGRSMYVLWDVLHSNGALLLFRLFLLVFLLGLAPLDAGGVFQVVGHFAVDGAIDLAGSDGADHLLGLKVVFNSLEKGIQYLSVKNADENSKCEFRVSSE